MPIFSNMVEQTLKVFMDDLVFEKSFDDCLHNLENVFNKYKETNLVLNWEKCYFMVQERTILG